MIAKKLKEYWSFNSRSLKSLARVVIDWLKQLGISKNFFNDLKYGLQHMPENNFSLGIMHLANGDINDAILRFKLVRKLAPEKKNPIFFLGRCYYEKFEFPKAMQYFMEYVDIGGKDLLEETEYCMNVINRKFDKIHAIPYSLLALSMDRLAESYDDMFFNDQDIGNNERSIHDSYMNLLLDAVKRHNIKLNRVLEIGTYTGYLGKKFKRFENDVEIIGMDISSKMKDKASSLRYQKEPVYAEVSNTDMATFLSTQDTSNMKYDLISIFDYFAFYTDLEKYFAQLKLLMYKNSMLAIIVNIDERIESYSIGKAVEQFFYNPEYVEKAATKAGLKLDKSQDIIWRNDAKGKVMIFTPDNTKVEKVNN
jgi:predicted TPR repeat methyltransferase